MGYANAMEIRRLLEEAGSDAKSVLVTLQPWIQRAALELYLAQLNAIRGPVDAVIAELNTQAQHGKTEEEKAQARARLQAPGRFDPMMLIMRARSLDLKMLEAETKNLSQGIALLPDHQQLGLLTQLQIALDELSYLIETGDFKDKRFWQSVAVGQ